MSAIAETLGVARSNLAARAAGRPSQRRGRPPLPEAELGRGDQAHHRYHADLRLSSRLGGSAPHRRGRRTSGPNHKRVYRVMRAHGLLLERHGGGAERRHDGRIISYCCIR